VTDRLGIVAGCGGLPRHLVECCRAAGRDVFVLAIEGAAEPTTVEGVPHAWCRLGAAAAGLALLRKNDVTELVALQAEILDSAQRLVKHGGRLIYATCSLLREENEEQAENFLATHPDFTLVPIGEVWESVIGGKCPGGEKTLRLTPARHGTDGFFVAILERRAAGADAADAA